MEALIQRFDLMEERMDEVEEENKGLMKEIASLKRQNIDYQEELSAVKSHMTSLDRKYRVKTQQETTPSTIKIPDYKEEISEIKDQIKYLKRKLSFFEKSRNSTSTTTTVTDGASDQRLSSLEQRVCGFSNLQKLLNRMHFGLQSSSGLKSQFLDLKQRVKRMESIEELRRKCVFNVGLRNSSPLSSVRFTRIDKWLDGSYVNPGGVFIKETGLLKLPVHGFYGFEFAFHIDGGEIELSLRFPSGDTSIAKSGTRSRIVLFKCNPGDYSIAARKISGNPQGFVCIGGWLIQPI